MLLGLLSEESTPDNGFPILARKLIVLEASAMTTWLQSLQMHEIVLYGLVFGLPIVAIGFSSVVTITKALIKHRERMAMIEQGLDPDYGPEEPEDEDSPAPRPGNLDETQPYVAGKG